MRIFLIVVGISVLFCGCATTQETKELRHGLALADQELGQFKTETSQKLAALARETESIRKQLFSMTTTADDKEDRMKQILGKLDELEHQFDTLRKETKKEIEALRKGNGAAAQVKPTLPVKDEEYEAPYRDAFDTFQKGMFSEAAQKFLAYLNAYPKSPLSPNAYFWLGESFAMLKDYDKAILYFQELLDKFPKSDMAPKALLSQADAFANLKDKKSSMTILKKVIELYPKTEEAAIAERKLRNLNL